MEPEDVENAPKMSPSTSAFHCILVNRSNSPETQMLDHLEIKIKAEINIENQECLESGEEDKNKDISVYDKEHQNAIEFGEFSSAAILPNATQEMIPTEYAVDNAIIKSYPCDDLENNQPQIIDNNNDFPGVTINTMSRQEMIRDILENIAFVELPRIEYFQRNFVCSTCYAIYDCLDALQAHKSSHLIEYNILFNKQRLAELKAKYRRKIEYICNECDYICYSSGHLKKHKRKHSTETPYHCDVCNFKCKAPNYLRQHKMIHTGETRYNCKECNYKCRFLKSLRLHEMKHSGIMPFSCQFCNYRCRLASDLKKHLLIHNGTKDFKCDQCLYSCLRAGDLKIHKMIHSDEKPFKCDACEYVCRRRGDLRKHKTTHGNQNLLQCNECHYECRSPISMKRHSVIHNDFIDPALLAESSTSLADPDSISLAHFLASSHVMQEACNEPVDDYLEEDGTNQV